MIAVILACSLSVFAQKEIVFSPQWTAQTQFAGFYVADAKGNYREAGLNMHIQHPSVSNPCINRLMYDNGFLKKKITYQQITQP